MHSPVLRKSSELRETISSALYNARWSAHTAWVPGWMWWIQIFARKEASCNALMSSLSTTSLSSCIHWRSKQGIRTWVSTLCSLFTSLVLSATCRELICYSAWAPSRWSCMHVYTHYCYPGRTVLQDSCVHWKNMTYQKMYFHARKWPFLLQKCMINTCKILARILYFKTCKTVLLVASTNPLLNWGHS